jgi:hypothetical protein
MGLLVESRRSAPVPALEIAVRKSSKRELLRRPLSPRESSRS